jgi:galactonate dehydratase
VFGWGESGLSGREKAVAGAIEHYAQFLVGRDPMQAGALWQEMYRSQYFEGGRVLSAAISAIDIALHDIRGKALGVPSTSCSAASSATACRPSLRPRPSPDRR